jgi:hypothetical protein
MTTALKFLSRMTDEIFESQMQRAAQKIADRGEQIFHRRAA